MIFNVEAVLSKVHKNQMKRWQLTVVLLGDLLVLVVPHHHGHRRADDVTHHLRRLAVAELLRRLNVPERQPL